MSVRASCRLRSGHPAVHTQWWSEPPARLHTSSHWLCYSLFPPRPLIRIVGRSPCGSRSCPRPVRPVADCCNRGATCAASCRVLILRNVMSCGRAQVKPDDGRRSGLLSTTPAEMRHWPRAYSSTSKPRRHLGHARVGHMIDGGHSACLPAPVAVCRRTEFASEIRAQEVTHSFSRVARALFAHARATSSVARLAARPDRLGDRPGGADWFHGIAADAGDPPLAR